MDPGRSKENFNLFLKLHIQLLYAGVSVSEGEKLMTTILLESEKARPLWQRVSEYLATKIGEISLFHITLNRKDQLRV